MLTENINTYTYTLQNNPPTPSLKSCPPNVYGPCHGHDLAWKNKSN